MTRIESGSGADACACAALREVVEQGLKVLREGATLPQLEDWAAFAQAALDEANKSARFWFVSNGPYPDDPRYANGWYWQDDECEEPMGPFQTRAEANGDYADLRGPFSPNGAIK